MISFAPWRPAPETRSYTSAVVNAIESAAAGTGGGVATATAAVEAAAGTWARALSLATVEPRTRRTAAITPSLLAMIGRALCRSGEIVFDLEVRGGRLMMLPASAAYVTTGSGDRRTWIYTVTVDGPGSAMTNYRARSGVAHLTYIPGRTTAGWQRGQNNGVRNPGASGCDRWRLRLGPSRGERL